MCLNIYPPMAIKLSQPDATIKAKRQLKLETELIKYSKCGITVKCSGVDKAEEENKKLERKD